MDEELNSYIEDVKKRIGDKVRGRVIVDNMTIGYRQKYRVLIVAQDLYYTYYTDFNEFHENTPAELMALQVLELFKGEVIKKYVKE